ncbi:MAG: FtsQ-type POTRA domain-containing protein [Ruminococcaceae bacterium]|nr:FtsQ-type POTRA domain-containing protein [Oscillospiraceae bacterium]
MFTSRSFEKKFGRRSTTCGRGYTPLWPWRACFWSIFCLSAAMLLTAALLILGMAWQVSSVSVEGTHQYDAADIAENSGIRPGDSMMSFGRKNLEASLREQYPLIRSLKISRSLDGRVTLKVTEETELYYTCHHSNYYLISGKDHLVLGVSSEDLEYRAWGAMYLGFPEEARIRVGEKISFLYLPYEPVSAPSEIATYEIETDEAKEEYAYVWSFVEAIEESPMAGRVTGMELEDRYDLYLVFDGHVKIRFGNMKQLDKKIDRAVELLLKELDGTRIPAEMNVSDLQKCTYRSSYDIQLPTWAES